MNDDYHRNMLRRNGWKDHEINHLARIKQQSQSFIQKEELKGHRRLEFAKHLFKTGRIKP